MRILRPHHCYSFVGFDDEFEIGDILSTESEISGLSIHLVDFGIRNADFGIKGILD
jgi:hypothetical protein